jgi:YopX protein
MREILSRGIREDNNEWVTGYYGYKDITDEHFIIVPTLDLHSEVRPQYFTDHIVKGVTVCEHTGLEDIEESKIFTGDIVQAEKLETVIVEEYVVTLFLGCYMFGKFNAHDFLKNHTKIKVIGNIFEKRK